MKPFPGLKIAEGLPTVSLQMLRPTLVLCCILCLCPAPSGAEAQVEQPEASVTATTAPAATDDSLDVLVASVRALGLGEGAFIIGSTLTEEQALQARGKLLADNYPGTIKFSSGEFGVVADEKTNLILAIFQRREEIYADDVKEMIGHLMTRFGEPTSMAHGKLIYWAYGNEGKVEEKTYRESKTTGILELLATVKFSSTLDLNPGLGNDNTEETGTIYYIITSDRLLNRYITTP